MELKKLPKNVQASLTAAPQINTYKSAIEQLVYNSLDSNSNSIAIRIHIEKQTLQVIDNGIGITKSDFPLLGQRYTTSKTVDLSTLKSAPNKYGFRGQSLANIIEVSQCIKITSRYGNEETLVKTFYNGQEKDIFTTISRPSKGTTIDIKGFLYNLNIRSKNIDTLNEINNIKILLEKLSLVHNNISLSLRDNSTNEIIFQIHKNRDIYQTLSSLFGIERYEIQELQVEKHQYQVTAYISKSNKEFNHHWIFLNGRFVNKCKLHKIIFDNFKKLCLKNQREKSKLKESYYVEENIELRTKYTFYYWLFIKCPYYDYDLNNESKISILEFKNWDQIKKILEKLLKFYAGDINLKEISKVKTAPIEIQRGTNDVRDEIKKIINRVLGNNTINSALQICNGVKGKQIKRKKKNRDLNISVSKILAPKNGNVHKNLKNITSPKMHPNYNEIKTKNKTEIKNSKTFSRLAKKQQNCINKTSNKKLHKITKNVSPGEHKIQLDFPYKVNSVINSQCSGISRSLNQKVSKSKTHKKSITKKEPNGKQKKNVANNYNKNIPLAANFENNTKTVKQKCEVLAKKVDELLDNIKKKKRDIYINETIEFSNVIGDNKNLTIRKRIGEIVIHDYIPLPPKISKLNTNKVWNQPQEKTYLTTYDLVKTILDPQQVDKRPNDSNLELYPSLQSRSIVPKTFSREFNFHEPPIRNFQHKFTFNPRCITCNNNFPHIPLTSGLTFKSHNYHFRNDGVKKVNVFTRNRNKPFIIKLSKDNFIVSEHNKKKLHNQKSTDNDNNFNEQTRLANTSKSFTHSSIKNNRSIHHSLYTIEYIDSNDENPGTSELNVFEILKQNDVIQNDNDSALEQNIGIGNTYTIAASQTFHNININQCEIQKNLREHELHYSCKSLNIHHSKNKISRSQQNLNMSTFCVEEPLMNPQNDVNSVSWNDIEETLENNVQPLNICETVFDSMDIFDEEFEYNVYQNGGKQIDTVLDKAEKQNNEIINSNQTFEINHTSYHFDDRQVRKENTNVDINHPNTEVVIFHNNESINCNKTNDNINLTLQKECKCINTDNITKIGEKSQDINNFQLTTRHRFLPKGMSQIFGNCKSESASHYYLDKEYYNDNLYQNFATNVHMNTKIFEPTIQDVKEFITKDISKVNAKFNKDNATLIFNSQSLKHAKILGQVDEKFIAAILRSKKNQPQDETKFLVLFDQHAVHERIKLENNLSEYFIGREWKSVIMNDIILKLPKEEVLYLHNYKDKLNPLGLRWNILNNNDVSVNAIPEAILGKNTRQADLVIKAVKNLISEEINTIKSQGGCVSLYPKTIMDLIFSEACRYAIKFGDKLQKDDCVELLEALSNCKTPFQCAHGRPVMAVLFDIDEEKREYEVDTKKITQFRQKQKMNL